MDIAISECKAVYAYDKSARPKGAAKHGDKRGRPAPLASDVTELELEIDMTTRMKITLEVPEGRRFVPMVREIARTLLKHYDASRADINGIEVILGELCSNVTKHAQSGAGCYLVTLEHHADHAVVIVTDTGPGLNRDQVAEVGTARKDEDGSERFGGFGLQIVESLADQVEYGKTDPQGTTVQAKMRWTPEAHWAFAAHAPGRPGPPSESGDITERKKIESSLTEYEAHFRALYETMPIGILYQDAAGTLISANPAAQRILGLTLGNLEEHRSADLLLKAVHEDGTSYPGDQHPPMQALRTGQPVLGVVMGVFSPVLNETRWLRVSSVPQFRPGEARPCKVYSTFEEISKRKQEEAQIRLLAAAVENDVILITEAEPIGQPGPRVVYVNDAFTRMTGYTREEVLGKTPRILQGPGTDLETCDFLRRQLAAWKPVEVELLNYRKDGTSFWVQLNIRPVADANGWYTHWVAIQRDISERKDAERQLAAAALKNERIAETLQRSMLQTPPTDKFPGVMVETLYMAAMKESDVGGDFFDAFALGTGRVAVVIGDVSGKGLAAAGRTAEVKYALRAFLHAHQSPEVALTHLNEFIYETHRLDADSGETFIVLALAVLDTGTGEATFSSAGAEPSLILRGDGTAEAVEIIGMPLGIHANSQYTARTAHLKSGETVLMATDGITEARSGHEFLGWKGLESLAVQAGPSMPPGALIQAVYDGALAFAGGALCDDACLLVARRN